MSHSSSIHRNSGICELHLMNRHQRDKERIDYKILSETGNKISKEANVSTTDNQTSPRILEISNLLTNFSMTEEQKFGHMDQVSVDQLTLAADIRDVIDENPSDEIISINEIESVLMKIEQLRTQYRNTHIQLQLYMKDDYEKSHHKQYDALLSEIKTYIKELKYKKHSIKHVKISAERYEAHAKQKSLKCLIGETKRLIHELGKEFNKNISSANDDEIKYMKNNLNKQISKVDNISKDLKELIENASENKETVFDGLSKSYKDLIRDKELYTSNIEKEVESRELHKLETCKASCLNMNYQNVKVMIQRWTSSHFSQRLKNFTKNELQEQCYLIY